MSWYSKAQSAGVGKITVRQLEKIRKASDEIDTILGYLGYINNPGNLQSLIEAAPAPWNRMEYSRKSWPSLLKNFLSLILNSLVVEKRYPEELIFSVIEAVAKEELPKISQMQNPSEELSAIFVRIYDKEHLIRRMMFDISTASNRVFMDNPGRGGPGEFDIDVPRYLEWKKQRA